MIIEFPENDPMVSIRYSDLKRLQMATGWWLILDDHEAAEFDAIFDTYFRMLQTAVRAEMGDRYEDATPEERKAVWDALQVLYKVPTYDPPVKLSEYAAFGE